MEECNRKFKKVKLDINEIKKKMNDESFDINEHELMTFMFIFNKIININEHTENKNEKFELDDTDGIVDVLSSIVKRIILFINTDIDLLDNRPKQKEF